MARTKGSKQEDRLKLLAQRRVPRAIKWIGLTGKLGRYSPTEAQIGYIVGKLKDAVAQAEIDLRDRKKTDIDFHLE